MNIKLSEQQIASFDRDGVLLVDMGKVLVESNKKTVLLLMLGGYTI